MPRRKKLEFKIRTKIKRQWTIGDETTVELDILVVDRKIDSMSITFRKDSPEEDVREMIRTMVATRFLEWRARNDAAYLKKTPELTDFELTEDEIKALVSSPP